MLVGRGTQCRCLLALQEVQLWDFFILKSHLQTLSQRKIIGLGPQALTLNSKANLCFVQQLCISPQQAFAMNDVTESYL